MGKAKHPPKRRAAIFLTLSGAVLMALLLTAVSCAPQSSLPAAMQKVYAPGASTIKQAEPDSAILDVPYLSQAENLPTGCEIVCAAMVLQYYGYDLPPEDFTLSCVEMAPLENGPGNTLTGPSPDEAFVGSPWDSNSYGCYAPVIQRAMDAAAGWHRAHNTTGTALETLTARYVKQGTPVLVWVTIGMQPSYAGSSWQVKSTGETFTWRSREHCMVLVGSDDNSYFLLDPYQGNGLVRYSKNLVEQRFAELGKQSVVFY